MKLTVASVCDRGLSPKRPVNEDRALVLAQHGLFVVCDGVGGHNSGEVASQLAIDTIEEVLTHHEQGAIEDLLLDAVRYANRDIYEMAASQTQYDGMGTTIALLYLDLEQGKAVIEHAGDSRVYRYDGARLHRETHDHTDLEDAVRAGRVSREQAHAQRKQNTINRALGIEAEVIAEIKSIRLTGNEAFLLCSDGVTRHIDDDELEELFQEGLDAATICEEIRSRCYARGAEDNLTAIVVYTAAPRQIVPFVHSIPSGQPARVEVPAQPAPRRHSGHLPQPAPSSGVTIVLALVLAAATGVAGFLLGRYLPAINSGAKPATAPATAAREAFERGDVERSRLAFTTLSQQEPGNASFHYWLGRIALAEHEPAEAIMRFEECLRLDPSHSDACLFLAGALQIEMKDREASETLRRYVELRQSEPGNQPATGGATSQPGRNSNAR